MTTEEKLAIGLILTGLTGVLIWSLTKGPKYPVPCRLWICDELCRCDELHLESASYFDGQWQYWIPYPENIWVVESDIDTAIAQAKKCGY